METEEIKKVRHLFHSDPVSFHSQFIRIDGELYRSIPEEYIRRSYDPKNGVLTIEHSHTPFNEKPSIIEEFFNSKKKTLNF